MTAADAALSRPAPGARGCAFSPLLVARGEQARWDLPPREPSVRLPALDALPAPRSGTEPAPHFVHERVAEAAGTGAAAPVPAPRRPDAAPLPPAAAAAPAPLDRPAPDAAAAPSGPLPGREQRRDPELRRAFGELLVDLTGSEVLTRQAVQLLRAAIDRSSRHPATAPDEDALAAVGLLDDLGHDLAAAQQRLDEAESAHQEEQLERALAEQARLEAERRLRDLQRRVQRAGVELDVWSAPPVDAVEAVPPSMADLLERLQQRQLERVVLTGDPATALALDDVVHTGLHVQRTWEALLALRDYAAAKAAGTLDTDVQGYLERTPDGLCSWPAGRHARGESATVQHDPRLRAPRLLPVPPEVDPSGRAPMWAHMKLLSLGQTSPRLHYLDDTRRTGCVYVGYIGRHLPNTQTS